MVVSIQVKEDEVFYYWLLDDLVHLPVAHDLNGLSILVVPLLKCSLDLSDIIDVPQDLLT